jgi:hypothetical protein
MASASSRILPQVQYFQALLVGATLQYDSA